MGLNVCGNDVPVTNGCPSGNELLLFFGVNTQTGLEFKTWAQIKACLAPKPPIAGSVGDEGLPENGLNFYTNERLLNLGVANDNKIMFFLAGTPYYNYGNNKSFDYDATAGTIFLLNGNIFNEGDDFNLNTNQ